MKKIDNNFKKDGNLDLENLETRNNVNEIPNIEEENETVSLSDGSTLDFAGAVKNEDAEDMALDDERRVKILSPGMLVFRRFIRNRLAIVGTGILLGMFLFSYVGGLLSPYGEAQQFKRVDSLAKPFAGIANNVELRYLEKDGVNFDRSDQAKFISAKNTSQSTFEGKDTTYSYEKITDNLYIISGFSKQLEAFKLGKFFDYQKIEGIPANPDLQKAFETAIKKNEKNFTFNDENYAITIDGKTYSASVTGQIVLASTRIMVFSDPDIKNSFGFQLAAELAIEKGDTTFKEGDETYTIQTDDQIIYQIFKDDTLYAQLSTKFVQAVYANDFLSLAFMNTAIKAVDEGKESFTFGEGEDKGTYHIIRNNLKYEIKKDIETTFYNEYAYPSRSHWLGTDGNGMDMLTRLMYGGRISLMVGFIVVLISMFLGIILGGISGYFGGWIDNLIMRLVDISYSIPTYPILIILGGIMDSLEVKNTARMLYLMVTLGILGWSGIARLVRGQILGLRDQEFMVAAECSGLSIKRRIFKHLVPNVMPQLIVSATMSLGSTILTESTLSFLGLGVKFPFASWGNIINSVSNQFVMTNYPATWIPAGFCILITVLAFNFVGDGLRDAFDPKMKR